MYIYIYRLALSAFDNLDIPTIRLSATSHKIQSIPSKRTFEEVFRLGYSQQVWFITFIARLPLGHH